jgi:hypothetical protein
MLGNWIKLSPQRGEQQQTDQEGNGQRGDQVTGDPHRPIFMFFRKLVCMGHDGEPRQTSDKPTLLISTTRNGSGLSNVMKDRLTI